MQIAFSKCLAIGWALAVCCVGGSGRLRADGPADNQPSQVRPYRRREFL